MSNLNQKSIENRFYHYIDLMRIVIFSFYLLKFSMKLDGKSIQVAIAQLVEDTSLMRFKFLKL